MTRTVVEQYMARLDGPDPRSGLELVEPDIEFNLHIPSGRVSGSSVAELEGYVTGRPPVVRVHNVLRAIGAGTDFEAVYGVVTDDGVETGAFLSTARISPAGRIAKYLVYFDLDIRLFNLADLPAQEQA
jgi:hypothetical protein